MRGNPERSKFAWKADRKQHRQNYARSQQMGKNSDGAKGGYSVQPCFYALHRHCTKVKSGFSLSFGSMLGSAISLFC